MFSKVFYYDIHDYFHPNFHKFIHQYTCEEDNLFFLPPYHGCGLKNKFGRKIPVDYKNGKKCTNACWRQEKLRKFIYPFSIAYTRYMPYSDEKVKTFFKSKEDYIYNYRTNQFDHLSITPIGDSYHRYLEFKNIYLKYYLKKEQ